MRSFKREIYLIFPFCFLCYFLKLSVGEKRNIGTASISWRNKTEKSLDSKKWKLLWATMELQNERCSHCLFILFHRNILENKRSNFQNVELFDIKTKAHSRSHPHNYNTLLTQTLYFIQWQPIQWTWLNRNNVQMYNVNCVLIASIW